MRHDALPDYPGDARGVNLTFHGLNDKPTDTRQEVLLKFNASRFHVNASRFHVDAYIHCGA